MPNKIVIAAFAMLIQASHAMAEITDSAKQFTAICKADQTIGFNWENSEWVHSIYKSKTYIISKLYGQKDSRCLAYKADEITPLVIFPTSGQKMGFSQGCYVFQEIGEPPEPLGSVCSERWVGDSNRSTLQHVICAGQRSGVNLEFDIDGQFVHTYTESLFSLPIDGQKDSIILDIGKCSHIP